MDTPLVNNSPPKLGLNFFGAVVVAIIGIILGLIQPFAGLTSVGHTVLAALVITIGLWIFRPGGIPYTAGSAVLLAGALVAKLKFPVVMSGFSGSALWVLIPALYFGFVLQKTGLGKRIVYGVFKSFKPSYLSLIVGWVIGGIILSALTPSIIVRVAIVVPIALSSVEACGFNPEETAFFNLLAWGMAIFPGTGWLTGSFWGPAFLGMFPAEIKELGNSSTWFQGMGLFWLIVTVLFAVLLYFVLKPKKALDLDVQTFRSEHEKLGPITKKEIICAVVLIAAFIMFSTERIHHIPTAATALSAFFLLMVFKVITPPDIGTGINWDIILFLGSALSLPAICGASGISKWISTIVQPVVTSWAGHPACFLFGFLLIYWVIRFIDVSWGFTTAALTAPIMVMLYQQFSIHPIIVAVIYCVGGNCFFLSYQQPFALMADAISEGKAWNSKQLSLGGLAYALACIIAFFICLPYWRAIGFIR